VTVAPPIGRRREVCEWLLSDEVGLGVPHLQPDGDGNTPALMARLEGHTELADLLESAVADTCAGCNPCPAAWADGGGGVASQVQIQDPGKMITR
jgi:hypothetical protein